MPRADKMMTVEEDKVFYWPDTGPVQYTTASGKIIKAQMVDEQDSWQCRTTDEALTELTREAQDLGLYDERPQDLRP